MLGLAGRFIGDDSGIHKQSEAVTRSLHLLGMHYWYGLVHDHARYYSLLRAVIVASAHQKLLHYIHLFFFSSQT